MELADLKMKKMKEYHWRVSAFVRLFVLLGVFFGNDETLRDECCKLE